MKDFRLPLGQGAAGQCALKQELLVLEDVKRYDFSDDKVDALSGYRTQSLICVPIVYAGRTLQEIAQKIQGGLSGASFAVAYGGDESVVVLPDTDRHGAAATAREIRDAIKAATFPTRWGRNVQALALCVGVCRVYGPSGVCTVTAR